MNRRNKSFALKRLLDVFCAATACLLLAPLLVLVALIIHWRLGSPVIYVALRVGKSSQIFKLYKFRSMTDECDETGQLLPDDFRITPLGRFLRKSSIDELPSLWNVLKGELSLVGPRPFSYLYLNRYTPEQNRRHCVTPGITGWSQINGRNSLTWEDKFKYDIWYIDNWSLWLDIRILFKTITLVFSRKNTSYDGFVSAPEFMGTLGQLKDANEDARENSTSTNFNTSS